MDIDKKLIELGKRKKMLESQATTMQNQMNGLQQKLGSLNSEYLLLLGKIQAYEDMKAEGINEE